MKDIKIAVACHKESMLPSNRLYIPVQVGAAVASKKLNMQHDDNGENISNKNSMYCELTAQYFAWKNWEADYYGLCHYRRFLYFGKQSFPTDNRKQIIAEILNETTCEKYGLNNEEEMRALIEANDCVVGKLEDVRNLPTPYGCKKTVYEHWIAHDRALIMKTDLDAMLAIMKEKYPQIAKDAEEYLAAPYFLGYNCFVMKKELFFQLCEFEFDVLTELEARVNLSTYNQQLKRIYGFMGEILYSVYIYHLEKQKKYKIAHIPVLYFNYTDAAPQFYVDDNIYTIAMVQQNTPHFMVAPVLESFLENCSVDNKYQIIIMHDNMDPYFINAYKSMTAKYTNVDVVFYNLKHIYGTDLERDKSKLKVLPWKPFLPWILKQHKRVLLVDWNHIFLENIDELFKMDFEEKCIASPLDVYEIGRVNGVYSDVFEYRDKKMKLQDVYQYINASFMFMELEKIRNKYSEKEFYDLLVKIRQGLSEKDAVNKIYEKDVFVLAPEWSVQTFSNTETKHHIPYAPNDIYSKFKQAEKKPNVMEYFPDDPWYPMGNQFDVEFWKYARNTPYYETFFAHMVARRSGDSNRISIIDSLFPKNSKRRIILIKLLPKKSRRYEFFKAIYDWTKK